MTVSNVILEQVRGRLVSDTLGYRGKEPATILRKIRVVERANMVLTVRGLRDLASVIEDGAALCDSLPAALVVMAADLADAPARYLPAHGAEVTAMGWHDGRVRCSRLLATFGDQGKVSVQMIDLEPGVYLAPSLGNHTLPADMTDDQIVKVALLQQEISIRHGLNICVGGDVEMASIDVTGITICKLAEYPDKAKTLARIARMGQTDEMIAA
jgi:hypothetical protein